MKSIHDIKTGHLHQMAEWRAKKYLEPELRHLFLELTLRCNERCLHCGSSCGETPCEEMTLSDYKKLLDEVKEDFGTGRTQLCITGGEPMLRRDFFEILGYAHELGFHWGMTSNATLITEEAAEKLAETGMGTISVSIDGLREHHDALRQTPGAYDRAMRGIRNLIAQNEKTRDRIAGKGYESDVSADRENKGKILRAEPHLFKHIQVTTVVHHQNIGDLDELFEILKGVEIDSWRIINMEQIGRALEHPELMLTDGDYRYLFDYIRDKRSEGWPVSYGCSHFLGLDYEREVRDWYWLCTAGIYTASVMTNGDIAACLDIERRPETIQGNIYKDRFSDVWRDRFQIFRQDASELNEKCAGCPDRTFCAGDSWHSWDFDEKRPRVCFRGLLWDS